MKEAKLNVEDAIKMIPDTEDIHTFVNPSGMLLGADWSREDIIEAFNKYGVQRSGEQAVRMKHGLVFHDGNKHVFVETVE